MKNFSVVLRHLANILSLLSYKLISSNFFVHQKSVAPHSVGVSDSFGMVIVTYEARQFTRAIPLLKQIRAAGVLEPISLVVNGNFNGGFDSNLKRQLLQELADIPDVFPLFLRKFHGLSHNWNLGIRLLGCKSTLVMNDDVWVDVNTFGSEISRILSESEESPLVTINRSFSHFVIRASALSQVGWFDERFVGIGEEDGDYFLRYCKIFSKAPLDFHTNSVVHFNDIDSGSEPKGVTKYSLANLLFANLKYSSPASGNPGVFGEFRTPNFDPTYRLPPEDFRRALGPWETLTENEFINRAKCLLSGELAENHRDKAELPKEQN